MQIDDVVWEIINQGHCSYKMKTVDRNFCKNEYNLTGLCSKQSCPLANSNYATVIEKKGVCYLYIKVVERVQRPKDMWEVIPLHKNYQQALQQIDTHLQYWSGFTIHKCKQRLTKLRQMLNRMRKLQLKGYNEYSVVNKKVERREKSREAKSLVAADLEGSIKQELLQRLKKGTYGDIYNLHSNVFQKVIGQQEEQYQQQQQSQQEESFEIDDISDLDSQQLEDYVVDFDTEEEEQEEEQEEEEQQIQPVKTKLKKINKNKNDNKLSQKKKPKIEIEYEDEEQQQQQLLN